MVHETYDERVVEKKAMSVEEDDGGWKEEGRLGRILVGVVPNLLLCGNREGSVPLPSR